MNNTTTQNESNTTNNTTTETSPKDVAEVLEWSYSGKAMRAQFIFYMIFSLLLLGGSGYVHFAGLIRDDLLTYFWIAIAGIVSLLWLCFYVTYFYRVWTIKYKLEGNCLYCYKGFFTQQRDTFELMYISDLQLVRTLFDIVLNGGVGKLIIFSSTDQTDSKFVITGIENPNHIFEVIDKTRVKLREKRAMITGGFN
ncbi:MAG: hypothetical protein LBH59_02105 [Planctomycetaceae bacterium]|jgi:uncharacterized membrane protein YdbT with pleckstrin-like domain|nr:hypothetical protein [Planctomycetaceae bacterium]